MKEDTRELEAHYTRPSTLASGFHPVVGKTPKVLSTY